MEDVQRKDMDDDSFPSPDEDNTKCNDVAYMVIDKDDLCTAYSDLTGRFPYKSRQGNEYILIAYHYDANFIYGMPIKNRKATTLATAWSQIHDIFTAAGVAPNVYVMDNEISNDLLAALDEKTVDYQLVPPHTHRRNLAERAIQTYKNHFKAGLASVDPNFPLSEWDRLIGQCNITLNLLRSARVHPKISAYTYICGEFDFKSTPLAPPGTKVVAHIKPSNRATYELNGEMGWYIGPSMNHYRCVQCYFPRTRTVRDCDTVTFLPTVIPFPEVSLVDHLKQAASDIVTILTSPPSPTTPSLQEGDPIRAALTELATQFQAIENLPEPPKKVSKLVTVPVHTKNKLPPSPSIPSQLDVASQRVREKESSMKAGVPMAVLQQHSKLSKNSRYQQIPTHRYQLRSRAQNKYNLRRSSRDNRTPFKCNECHQS